MYNTNMTHALFKKSIDKGDNMTLLQLHYFVTVAQTGQFTAAAKKLNMSQPPLSYQIKQLEENLGTKLFIRGPRSLKLTDAGMQLYDRALQILAMVDNTKKSIHNFEKGIEGVLSIGVISSASYLLPNEAMKTYLIDHPNVKYEVHEGTSFYIIDLIKKGIVDVAIVRTPFPVDGLSVQHLSKESMVAVIPSSNELAQKEDADCVTINELAKQPLVIYRRFEHLLTHVFSLKGIQPIFRCKNDDARTTLQWATQGFGVGIVPLSATLNTKDNNDIVIKPINHNDFETSLSIVWKENREPTPLEEIFINLIQSSFE